MLREALHFVPFQFQEKGGCLFPRSANALSSTGGLLAMFRFPGALVLELSFASFARVKVSFSRIWPYAASLPCHSGVIRAQG